MLAHYLLFISMIKVDKKSQPHHTDHKRGSKAGKIVTTQYYKNCRLYTPDRPGEVFNCFGTTNGKFSFVGQTNEILEGNNYPIDMMDLKGATVLPGFMDGHVHAPGLAYEVLFNLNLFQTKTKDEVLSQIEAHIVANPQKEIYYGRGVNAALFGSEEAIVGPRKEHLDRICDQKPIVIADFGGNYIWLNSVALRLYGISNETPVPRGGEIPVDPLTGQVWGVIRNEARSLIPFQKLTVEENRKAALWFQNKMLSYGYTAIFALRPPGTVEPRTTMLEVFRNLEHSGNLKMRVFGARDIAPDVDMEDEIHLLCQLKEKYNSALVKFTTAKFFLDGVVEGGDAFLLAPYERTASQPVAGSRGSDNTAYGLSIWQKDKLTDMFERCMENGISIHCHSIGDGAVHLALDAISAAVKRTGVTDHRTTLTHLQLVSEEDKKRMADLNVIANVQPYWHFKSPSLFEPIEKSLLGARAEYEYPLRSLLNQGVTVSASSDYPVTPEPNAFVGIQVACTRNLAESPDFDVPSIKGTDDPTYLLNINERADVATMIKAFSINNAIAQKGEKDFGTITVGKSADYILVDQDPFHTAPGNLGKIAITQTVFQSEVVYRKE